MFFLARIKLSLLFMTMLSLFSTKILAHQELSFPPGAKGQILAQFFQAESAKSLESVRAQCLQLGGQAVPAVLRVMKDSRFPDHSRWAATFLLAQIAGNKATPVLQKFLEHPNWMMKVASLKALLALGERELGQEYAKLLQDPSLLVRMQALENIRHLQLRQFAPQVWAMLYDENNYDQYDEGVRRGDIIRNAILTIGDLEFKEAKTPLFSMVQNDRYKDIFNEMDYSLQRITGRQSPQTSQIQVKRRFWQNLSLASTNL